MILIDADTVATRVEEMPCYYDECIDTIEAIVEMIKYDIPPVKAIPVEWLEKKLNCCDNINVEIFVKALIREWENNEWLQ